jgi:hypothetical protein
MYVNVIMAVGSAKPFLSIKGSIVVHNLSTVPWRAQYFDANSTILHI